jgi:hypothetical protein
MTLKMKFTKDFVAKVVSKAKLAYFSKGPQYVATLFHPIQSLLFQV